MFWTITTVVFASPASALEAWGESFGDGSGCSSCESEIIRQPENVRGQAQEVLRQLESKTESDLGVLIAAGDGICEVMGCLNLDAGFVKNLAERVERERLRAELRRNDWWQFMFNVLTAVFTLVGIAISIFALRKKKRS